MLRRNQAWSAVLGGLCCLNLAAPSSAVPPQATSIGFSETIAVLSQPPAAAPANGSAKASDSPAEPVDSPKPTVVPDLPEAVAPPSTTDDPSGALDVEPDEFDFRPLLQMTPLDKIRVDPMPYDHDAPATSSLTLDERTFGDLRELRMEQGWNAQTLYWRPTNFAHRPLYFEDVLLERHGQKRRHMTQPLWSAAHFFGTFPILPYKMGVARPWECVYTLGYERPGSCKRSMRRRFVWEADAAALESSAWIAAVLLLP